MISDSRSKWVEYHNRGMQVRYHNLDTLQQVAKERLQQQRAIASKISGMLKARSVAVGGLVAVVAVAVCCSESLLAGMVDGGQQSDKTGRFIVAIAERSPPKRAFWLVW